ncbi:hypothetical protein [Actinomadura latina]|uniref:Uncharacterized protein n=1 Tax=Actinomadura latina TaxID=163603 RepID=A0A846Z644_9ACTN|nr:hypothetical protein [Actinomadura latina]NKZ07297.1 hypothetical protein [Actinomadura latina]
MTTYVVPCGRSVHDGLHKKEYCPQGVTPGRFARAEEAWWPQALAKDGDAAVAAWADELEKQAAASRLPEWSTRVSAEVNTVAVRVLQPLPALLAAGHRILLLASDTGEGMAAALTCAYIFAGGDTGRIGCVTAPTDEDAALGFSERLPGGRVTVVRIPRLAPDSSGLRDAVAAIGYVLRAAYDLGGPLEVHLTGGFKITLLHTLTMTEILYSRNPVRTSAWYIFDEAKGAKGPDRLDLRRFPEEHLCAMRRELSGVALTGRVPVGGSYRGVAWKETADGRAVLTEFGHGHLAVLGGPVIPGAADGSS